MTKYRQKPGAWWCLAKRGLALRTEKSSRQQDAVEFSQRRGKCVVFQGCRTDDQNRALCCIGFNWDGVHGCDSGVHLFRRQFPALQGCAWIWCRVQLGRYAFIWACPHPRERAELRGAVPRGVDPQEEEERDDPQLQCDEYGLLVLRPRRPAVPPGPPWAGGLSRHPLSRCTWRAWFHGFHGAMCMASTNQPPLFASCRAGKGCT